MINGAGREIPEYIDGMGSVKPYGTPSHNLEMPQKRSVSSEKKTLIHRSLRRAVERSGLANGDRISFHHHLRLGDRVIQQVLPVLEEMGYRDLILCLSSIMGEAASAVDRAIRKGIVRRIETTGLKSPLSESLLSGSIAEPVLFRSHGGRARAVTGGEIEIKLAFIAASAADREGNLSGTEGPNRFGSLGYAMVDAAYSSYTIGITDYISETPLKHTAIVGGRIDEVVFVESIGDRQAIGGGSLRKSDRPIEKLIARKTLDVLLASGKIEPGFSYQAGSGGISLLVSGYLKEYMKKRGVRGSFASGGATGSLIDMLNEGLFEEIWDVQSFDDRAAVSLMKNSNHREMSASLYANPHHPGGCIAEKLDVMVLSATEIDRNFHVNSITGTNGKILGALGGAPDTAFGADLTVVVMPSFRGRIPTVTTEVRTVCTPGSSVDILVTERGISVNPLREDLLKQFADSGFSLIKIDDLINKIENLTGKPDKPDNGERIAGVVEYRDGTILDCIRI